MASSTSGSSHLGVTDNQKRWLVFGIALNKILVPQIRPFVEQEVDKEYNNLKISHNIHSQSTSGRLQRWPPRKILKYENINGNSRHPKLPGGKYNFFLFDCRVLSHIDFARLYVENFMAKFNAFDDHCDASAVLTLLGGVPVFSAAMQAAAGDVKNVRNDWAHCVFSKWDPTKFQQSFVEMEHLVRVMALPAADEAKLLGELKDWETKGTLLCMISPVDPALVQLVQEDLKFLQDYVDNLSVEFVQEKVEVRQELENIATVLQDWMKQMVESLNVFQGDANERIGSLENRTGQFEEKVMSIENTITNIQETFRSLTVKETVLSNASVKDPLMPIVFPEKLVEVIRRDYKGAVLCPFPWCEDELQLKLSTIFTRLQINSRKKERSKLTNDTVNMTDVFKPHPECDNPRVVLIEGNPGMGKTTYCQKLAYDWSVGEIPPDASFSEVKMLLLLKCRDMHMKIANIEEAIDDQLLPQDAGKKEKEDFFHFIRSNQSRVLLVLDGLDELREDLVQGFLPLIQGRVFANVYLILTSRHEAGMKVRRYCDTLLEIIGYSKDDVEGYIKKYFSSHEDQSLADKMIQKLNTDRHLKELTANPLNTALLCLLCEETRGEFPSKRTNMYDDFVACALRRYFAKRGIYLGDEDPVERCASELNQLGKMAFEALLKNQLYFTQDEMKSPPTVDFLRLPFLSREPSVSKIRPTPCYAFTHKTFQEYFAAFYLAHQLLSGDKGKESLRLDELSPIDNWQVWEFLITMVSSKSAEAAVTVVSRLCAFFYLNRLDAEDDEVILDAKIFESDPHDWTKYITTLSEDEETLMHVVCDTLDVIAKCEDGDNELEDYQKKMVRVVARCFPLKKLKFTLYDDGESTFSVYSEYLKFNYSLTDLILDSALDPLLLRTIEHTFHSKKKLVHFNLNDIFLAMDCNSRRLESFLWMQSLGIKNLLAEFSQSGCVLTHLNLYDVWIGDEGVQALAEFLETNRTLTHVNIHGAMITDTGATALGKALQLNSTLTHLSLPRNRLSGVGAKALATSLKSNSVLIFFDLSKNLCGGDSVAIALSKAVKSNCSLQYLNLSLEFGSKLKDFSDISEVFRCLDERSQMIGPRGGSALARALCFNCTLTYLDLSRNNINNSGAAALGDALLTNRTLTELYLEDNNIGKIGAVALGKALESNRTLTHLNLHGNRDIGNSGAAAIAKALWSNDSFGLTRLDLSGCQIRCSGASHIADALQTNCSLTHLGWSCNEVKSSGASAFARALKSNRSLTHLDLSSNGISDSGATELAQALHIHNNTLAYLDLTENHSIGSGGTESLAQVDQSKCMVKYSGRQ